MRTGFEKHRSVERSTPDARRVDEHVRTRGGHVDRHRGHFRSYDLERRARSLFGCDGFGTAARRVVSQAIVEVFRRVAIERELARRSAEIARDVERLRDTPRVEILRVRFGKVALAIELVAIAHELARSSAVGFRACGAAGFSVREARPKMHPGEEQATAMDGARAGWFRTHGSAGNLAELRLRAVAFGSSAAWPMAR